MLHTVLKAKRMLTEAWPSSPLKFLEKSKHDWGEDSWKIETTYKK